jgi:rod shape-determining protein MreD
LEVIKIILVLLILLIFQYTLIPGLAIQGISPDLLFIFIVIYSSTRTPIQGILLGFCGGFIYDVTAGGVLGTFSLSKSIVGYIASYLPWGWDGKNILHMIITLAIAGLIHQVIVVFLLSTQSAAGFVSLFFRYGFPSLLYTLVIGTVSLFVLSWTRKKERRD